MIETLGAYREAVRAEIKRIIDEAAHLDNVNQWGVDLRRRLSSFATRGKLIRGCLVPAVQAAFGTIPTRDAHRVGAVIELIQSFLLIHDDIMDEDPVRRGATSVHEQYRLVGVDGTYGNTQRFGESMGICAGDVAVLLAFEALMGLGVTDELKVQITKLVASEIADVGVAQMADVANGHRPSSASEEEILTVYRLKTGRYTFSVPLMLGALLAGVASGSVELISRWGELQGLIFQIRDDELGLLGEEADIGKPSGSDIATDKQTLHRALLLKLCHQHGCADLAELFGRADLTRADIERVRAALEETGTLREMERRVAELDAEAAPILDQISELDDSGRTIFEKIAEYNVKRTA
ncbi:MAG: polyprenyl synthetase family protein [Spirochaetota bacterium]